MSGVESAILYSNLITEFVESKEEVDLKKIAQKMIENGIFKTETDVVLFLFEGLRTVSQMDDAFPIHYYNEEEDLPDEEKLMAQPISLTDELIETELK